MKAVNDAAAAGGRNQYVNNNEKIVRETVKPELRNRVSNEVMDEDNIANGVHLEEKNPAYPATRARQDKEPINDTNMLKRVVEFAKNAIKSDPLTAFQAHTNLTPEKVMQFV